MEGPPPTANACSVAAQVDGVSSALSRVGSVPVVGTDAPGPAGGEAVAETAGVWPAPAAARTADTAPAEPEHPARKRARAATEAADRRPRLTGRWPRWFRCSLRPTVSSRTACPLFPCRAVASRVKVSRHADRYAPFAQVTQWQPGRRSCVGDEVHLQIRVTLNERPDGTTRFHRKVLDLLQVIPVEDPDEVTSE